MFRSVQFLVIISVLQITVLGNESKIDDVRTCTEFCSASGSIGIFKDGHCTCGNVNDEGAENIIRENRQVKNIVDPTLNSEDLTDEERRARCTLGSRRHLKHHDADRVVKYFINDGPSSGHAYFVGAANRNDNRENECKSEKNPDDSSNPFSNEQGLQLAGESYYQPDYNDGIVGASYNPIYLLPHEMPVAPAAINPYEHTMGGTYGPMLGSSNYILSQPIDAAYPVPRNRLLGGKLPRRTVRPRLNTLRHLSNTLLGLVREPVHEGLLGARSFLHNLIRPGSVAYSPNYIDDLSTVGRSNAENINTVSNPIVGDILNENAQNPKINSESAAEGNTQDLSEVKKSTNPVPSTQRANIPAKSFQTVPYNNQYFVPMYAPQQNPPHFNNMPRAYILHPVRIMPQLPHSAPSSEITGLSRPKESSKCENDASSDKDDNVTNSANTTTENLKEETYSDTTDSSIIKGESNGEKTLRDKSKTK